MKYLIGGALGAVVAAAIILALFSQYSDYRAAVETSGWIAQSQSAQRAVSDNATRLQSLTNSGIGVARPSFVGSSPEQFEVTTDGLIMMKGGAEGQLVVLLPQFTSGKVTWRCIGGSIHDVASCNREN